MALAPACTAPNSTTEPGSPAEPPPLSVHRADLDLGILFSRVQDAIVVASLASGEIALWNPAAERLFGYPANEAIGQSIEILMPTPMASVHRSAVERYKHTGRGLIMNADGPVEVPAVTKDGTDLRVQISLSEITSSTGERYAVAVMRDASHRKDVELMRLEIERLRRTSDALLGALASATHDIEVHGQDDDAAGHDRLPLLRHGHDA